jgi:hypothetical protein
MSDMESVYRRAEGLDINMLAAGDMLTTARRKRELHIAGPACAL